MTNINREELVKDFISNEEIIGSILLENRRVFDYSIKNIQNSKTGIELMKDLISDFIKEIFFFDKTINNKEDFFHLVKEYDLNEYIDWLVDIYDEDLVSSYLYFKEYVDICEWDEDIIEIMQRAQFIWFTILFENIKQEFSVYLSLFID